MSGASLDLNLQKRPKSLNPFLIFCILMFLLSMVFYSLIYLKHIQASEPKAEKLTSDTVKREVYQNLNPQPFGILFRGPIPAEFTTTTEKVTTLNVPQSKRYRSYPRNIQEVINYTKSMETYVQSPSQNVPKQFRNYGQVASDPFYMYKPEEPGDINLLATANLRFSPPIWSSVRKQSKVQQQQVRTVESHGNKNRQQPVTLMLNIYKNRGLKQEQHVGPRDDNEEARRNVFRTTKPKRMVIHLNLFQNSKENRMLQTLLASATEIKEQNVMAKP